MFHAWRTLFAAVAIVTTGTVFNATATGSMPPPKGEYEPGPAAVRVVDAVHIKVLDVKFEPVTGGRNTVRIQLKNLWDTPQVFALHLYTFSPKAGAKGLGWGHPVFETLEPDQTKWCSFEFYMHEPVTDDSYIRLHFYNPPSQKEYAFDKYFDERTFTVGKLTMRQAASQPATQPASEEKSKAAIEAFTRMQGLLRSQQYEEAWDSMTDSYRSLIFFSYDHFEKQMRDLAPFYWSRGDFQELEPQSVAQRGQALILTATRGGESWMIDLLPQADTCKIDWISGYSRRSDLWKNWERRVLPAMMKKSTEHVDVYAAEGTPAAGDIELIAAQREKAVVEIAKFLGKKVATHPSAKANSAHPPGALPGQGNQV